MIRRFLYRGKIYQYTSKGEVQFLLLFPRKTILIVGRWVDGIPWVFDDIRSLGDFSSEHFLALAKIEGKGAAIAHEQTPYPGERAEPYAIYRKDDRTYALPLHCAWGRIAVQFPDDPTTLYHVTGLKDETMREVIRIEQIDDAEKCLVARQVDSRLTGLASDAYDCRIRFSFEGKNYLLSNEAYREGKKIFIPDKGFFRTNGWLESMPVQLNGLYPVKETHKGDLREYCVAVPEEEAIDNWRFEYKGEE